MSKHYRFNTANKIQYGEQILVDFVKALDITWSTGNTFFVDYVIKDGDTAENMCQRLWQDSSLGWIINFINEKTDPFFDWPLNSSELTDYVKNKYGIADVWTTHHYVKNGYIVNENPSDTDVHTVTNYQYESELNDAKRKILLPTDEFMTQFITQLNALGDN